jgi:hypothetical protein
MNMPRGDGIGPPWGSGPGSGRGARGCLGPRSSPNSKISRSHVEKYIAFVETLAPLATTLVMLFRRFKAPRDHVGTLTRIGGEADDSISVKRGDEYAER